MMELAKTLPDYKRDPKIPLYLWLRQIVIRRLVDVHRRHIGAGRRDARREVNLAQVKNLAADSGSMAVQLSGRITSPLNAVLREEQRSQVQTALQLMEPLDREVIALRHFEQMNNFEVALVLEIEASAASKRYTRALDRLKQIMSMHDES
jgi:RNA polymerase sigma-70 factor (ECF subfamily)